MIKLATELTAQAYSRETQYTTECLLVNKYRSILFLFQQVLSFKVGSGPGLAFMAFSDAILQLDVSPFWSILFFFMFILLGIDSEFGVLEATIGPLMEMGVFPKSWRREVCTGELLLYVCKTRPGGKVK